MTINSSSQTPKAPKFSVVVSCYNYEKFVEQAIQSVHAQDYKNIECIIVDDASNDRSVEIISSVLRKLGDCQFSFIQLQENVGQTRALASGLEKATGQFVAFLDADDFWTPDFAASHIAAHLNTKRTAGMSCCDMSTISENAEIVGNTVMTLSKPRASKNVDYRQVFPARLPSDWLSDCRSSPEPLICDCFHFEQWFPAHWDFAPTSSTVYRTGLVKIFLENLSKEKIKNTDYYLSLLCSCFSGYIVIDRVCASYRMHGHNIMSRNPYTGGRHWMSGPWNHADRIRMAKPMVQAVVRNYGILKNLYGHWYVMLNLLKLGWPAPFRTLWWIAKITGKYLLFEPRSPKQA